MMTIPAPVNVSPISIVRVAVTRALRPVLSEQTRLKPAASSQHVSSLLQQAYGSERGVFSPARRHRECALVDPHGHPYNLESPR